jgi:hypothetical protein
MKLLSSIVLLAMASTAVAYEEYTMEMTTVLDGVSGDPDNQLCIDIFDAAVVTAYTAALPAADAQIEDTHATTVTPEYVQNNPLRTGTMGTYTYNSSTDFRCR